MITFDKFGREVKDGQAQWNGKLDRPMTRENFYKILASADPENKTLGTGSPPRLNREIAPCNERGGYCPECGSMGGGVVIASAIEWKGKHQLEVFWLQCAAHPNDPNHGFGSKSKWRSFRPYQKHNRKAPETPKTETAPKTETPKAPEAPKVAPKRTKVPDLGPGVVTHENFEKVFRLVVDGGVRAFLFEGPAGSGKTSMCPQLADALSKHHGQEFAFAMITGNAETEAAQLGVFKNPHDGTEKLSAIMTTATAPKPAVIVIDEADAIQPGNMLTLNAPVANRFIVLDGKRLEINPLTVFVITANASNGANRVYTGRFPMDGATKSRFLPIFCDYSPAIDRACCDDSAILSEVTALRKRVNNDPTLARTFGALVGTRLLIQAKQVGAAFGLTGRDAVVETLKLGNSPEALNSLGY